MKKQNQRDVDQHSHQDFEEDGNYSDENEQYEEQKLDIAKGN